MIQLQCQNLEARTTPAASSLTLNPTSAYAIGSGVGAPPRVQVLDQTGAIRQDFFAFGSGFRGGVTAALIDVNRDGVKDIVTAAGPGGGPHIKVYDGSTTLDRFGNGVIAGVEPRIFFDFFAFDPSFSGGVSLAAADVDGDGTEDIMAGAGAGGGPHVKVFSGRTGETLRSFFAFEPTFSGGVSVAGGFVDPDNLAEIVVGSGAGRQATVKIFAGEFNGTQNRELRNFNPYGQFTGGVNVAVGAYTLTLSGTPTEAANTVSPSLLPKRFEDIITAPASGGGPHMKVFDGGLLTTDPGLAGVDSEAPIASFMAFAPTFSGGVAVASADIDGDGQDDVIVGAGVGGAPHLKIFSANTGKLLSEQLRPRWVAADPWYTAGIKLGS